MCNVMYCTKSNSAKVPRPAVDITHAYKYQATNNAYIYIIGWVRLLHDVCAVLAAAVGHRAALPPSVRLLVFRRNSSHLATRTDICPWTSPVQNNGLCVLPSRPPRNLFGHFSQARQDGHSPGTFPNPRPPSCPWLTGCSGLRACLTGLSSPGRTSSSAFQSHNTYLRGSYLCVSIGF